MGKLIFFDVFYYTAEAKACIDSGINLHESKIKNKYQYKKTLINIDDVSCAQPDMETDEHTIVTLKTGMELTLKIKTGDFFVLAGSYDSLKLLCRIKN